MKIDDFRDKVFLLAKKKGFDDSQLLLTNRKEFGVVISKQNIENYTDAESFKIVFKGIKNGKSSFSTSEILDEKTAEFLVESAYENLEVTDTLEEDVIYDGSGEYSPAQNFVDEFEQISVKEKIDFAKMMEQKALSVDKRITMVIMSAYEHERRNITLFNTRGLQLKESTGLGAAFIYLIASDGQKPKRGTKVCFASKPSDIDFEEVVSQAANEALSQLGASSVSSGKYRAILRRDVFAELFTAFLPIFSAENVQKGLSPLKGKLGVQIASEKLTLIEDPLSNKTPVRRSFDNEGVPTMKKEFVKDGTLTTYFHSLKSAKKDGVLPTGNVFESKCVPLNVIVEPGSKSFDDLLKDLDSGLVITALDGLHSGVRTVSGDFSVSALGYQVEGGKIVKPVEQITISGNFIDLLRRIEGVGNDIKLVSDSFYTPSVLVEFLDVAGD